MITGRPINVDRHNAILLGLQTYTGLPHANCGETLRYVKGGGCVHCARAIATEQRKARLILRQMPLDTEPEVHVDEDDAEARRQASIDDLM